MRKNAGLPDLSFAVQNPTTPQALTARISGALKDMRLDVSPASAGVAKALRNLAKAVNLALQGDFLETRLEPVYEVARVRQGQVEIMHRDYIGLGDGIVASIGKVARSFVLTLKGRDPAAPPDGEDGGGPVRGVLDLLARKLNLVQEYEDMVPSFVEQTLDRLESVHMVVNWNRDEWDIDTKVVGLDVVMSPVEPSEKSSTRRKNTRRKAPNRR